MRSILLHAHEDGAFDARLQVALDVARAHDAHLTVLQPISIEIAVPGDIYGTLANEIAPVIRERAAAFRAATEQRLAGEDVRWDWVDRYGVEDSSLLRLATLSDLVVVGANDPVTGKGASAVAGALAIHAKVPVLAVPGASPGLAVDAPAVVAWNGSAESSRALRAAVPFLARSARVTLVTIGEALEWDDDDAAELPPVAGADYLARHGIDCELVQFPPERGSAVAQVLLEAARARDASYLVMGAYGHSRMRETLLGGATRDLLAHSGLPLLMAH